MYSRLTLFIRTQQSVWTCIRQDLMFNSQLLSVLLKSPSRDFSYLVSSMAPVKLHHVSCFWKFILFKKMYFQNIFLQHKQFACRSEGVKWDIQSRHKIPFGRVAKGNHINIHGESAIWLVLMKHSGVSDSRQIDFIKTINRNGRRGNFLYISLYLLIAHISLVPFREKKQHRHEMRWLKRLQHTEPLDSITMEQRHLIVFGPLFQSWHCSWSTENGPFSYKGLDYHLEACWSRG